MKIQTREIEFWNVDEDEIYQIIPSGAIILIEANPDTSTYLIHEEFYVMVKEYEYRNK